jgi:hypothetical protein
MHHLELFQRVSELIIESHRKVSGVWSSLGAIDVENRGRALIFGYSSVFRTKKVQPTQ